MFGHDQGELFHRPKLDDVTKDVYYSDLPTYSHDPPGHTCGLPCCREDLEVNIQSPVRSRRLCIPTKSKEKDDNFTFGRSIANLLQNRKTYSKFRSLPHYDEQRFRKRPPIPMFNDDSAIGMRCPYSISCPELDVSRNRQWNNISHRAICLPEMSEDSKKIIFPDFLSGETEDDLSNLDDVTLAFYATSPKLPIEAQLTSIEIVKPVTLSSSVVSGAVKDTTLSERAATHNYLEHYNSESRDSFHNRSRDWQPFDEFTDNEHYYDVLRSHTDYENTFPKYSELSPLYKTAEIEYLSPAHVRNNKNKLPLTHDNDCETKEPQDETQNDTELPPIYTKLDELPPLIEVEKDELSPIEEEEDEEFDDEDIEYLKINYVNTLVRKKLPKSALASPKPSPKVCRNLHNFDRYSTFPQRHKKDDVKCQSNQIPLQEIFPWGPAPCIIEIVSTDPWNSSTGQLIMSSDPWTSSSGQLDSCSDTSENYYEDIEFYPYKSESSYFGKSQIRAFGHKDVIKSSSDYSTGEISEAFKNSPITLIL